MKRFFLTAVLLILFLQFIQVPGATQQSFLPSANGNYAVIVTKDRCVAVDVLLTLLNRLFSQ